MPFEIKSGWGITRYEKLENGKIRQYFLVSDGTSKLHHVDPFDNFKVVKSVPV